MEMGALERSRATIVATALAVHAMFMACAAARYRHTPIFMACFAARPCAI
jgi:hypothetical protein